MTAGQKIRVRMDSILPEGLKLLSPEGDEVWAMPELQHPFQPGKELSVFLWRRDGEGRWWASLSLPALLLGEVAFLELADAGPKGYFFHWGLPKALFVPIDKGLVPLKPGMWAPIRLVEDPRTGNVMGTLRWKAGVVPADESYDKGRPVSLLVMSETEIGHSVLVDHVYMGMVYHNQAFSDLRPGQRLEGYVNFRREDGKLDILLRPPGFKAVTEAEGQILAKLQAAGGSLPYGDKTPPETIQTVFGMSKKVFKQAVGGLYKKGMVQPHPERLQQLEEEGD
jgi:uncharacterized protein